MRLAEHERNEHILGTARRAGTGRRVPPAETGGDVVDAARYSGSHPFRLAGAAAQLRRGRFGGAQRPGGAGQLRADAGAQGRQRAGGWAVERNVAVGLYCTQPLARYSARPTAILPTLPVEQ